MNRTFQTESLNPLSVMLLSSRVRPGDGEVIHVGLTVLETDYISLRLMKGVKWVVLMVWA